VTNIDDVLAQAKLPEDTVPICLRADLAAEYKRLERDLKGASTEAVSLAEPAPAKSIAKRMEELHAQMRAAETPFNLRALPSQEWAELYGRLPKRGKDEPEEEFRRTKSYPWFAELVARTVIDPAMTVDQVGQLVAVISGGQWNTLADACWTLNAEKEQIPFSVAAFALTAASGVE
jgi:hypothetical protein